MSDCKNGNCKNCNCKQSQPIGETRYEFFDRLGKFVKKVEEDSTPIGTGYTLSLTDPGTKDGYKVSFSTEITVFEFYNLFEEYFDGSRLQINIVNEEDLD